MTRKSRRLSIILVCGLGLGSAAALSLSAMSSNLVFFMVPSAIAAAPPPPDRTIRLGGMVTRGSLAHEVVDGSPAVRFVVTDGRSAITVRYVGILPDLFREGQSVVALGNVVGPGRFVAQEVLAKHDETYMPRDVEEALRKSGRWNPADGPPPAASTWNTMVASTTKGS